MAPSTEDRRKIGLLGAGAVGQALGSLLMRAGHDVVVGSRRGDASLIDAARHGEVVIVAVPFTAVGEVLPPLREHLRGKVVVDATNPIAPDWSPLPLGDATSAAEEVARLVPEASIVKAFNTVFADVMTPPGLDRSGRAAALFVAGDEEAACEAVASIGRSARFAPVMAGPLRSARYLEAMAHLNIAIATGGGGTNAAFLYDRRDA